MSNQRPGVRVAHRLGTQSGGLKPGLKISWGSSLSSALEDCIGMTVAPAKSPSFQSSLHRRDTRQTINNAAFLLPLPQQRSDHYFLRNIWTLKGTGPRIIIRIPQRDEDTLDSGELLTNEAAHTTLIPFLARKTSILIIMARCVRVTKIVFL